MILAGVHGPIPAWIFDLSPGFLRHLIDPAVRSLAIAAVIGLVMIVARVKDLSLRLSVWKAVVCAALAMPALAICLPALPVQLPVPERISGIFGNAAKTEVPTQVFVTRPRTQVSSQVPVTTHVTTNNVTRTADSSKSPEFGARQTDVPWSTLALGLYSTGALFLAFRFLVGWYLSQKLRQASRTIRDIGTVRRFRTRCDAAHLRAVPRFAESDHLTVPLTCGVVRPAVLLPADWRTWDVYKLDAVLTHEISHVARRDALTERLALLHRIIFWFSPLAWWLPRCLADLAEEASDQAALAAGAEPTKYAEILLGFFEDLNSASWRAHWQGVAMAQPGSAEKRLDRILNGRTIMSKHGKKTFAAVAIFASVPVILVAASLQPQRLGKQIVLSAYPSRPVAGLVTTQQSSTPVVPVAAAPVVAAPQSAPTASAEAAPVAEVSSVPTVSALPAPRAIPVVVGRAQPTVSVSIAPIVLGITPSVSVQAQAPTSPQAPVVVAPPPLAPLAPGRYSYSYSTDPENSYAIITGKTQTMSGSFGRADFAQLEALRKKMNSDFIWFERDGKSYVITDPEMVKRAADAFAAQAELGQKQGELGERQGRLGELQGVFGEQLGVLGEQMGQIGAEMQNMKVEIPDMTEELQALKLKTQELSQAINQKDLDAMGISMAQMQKQIAEATKQLNETQIRADVAHSLDSAALEAAMKQARAAIDEQMAKFSAEQSKLGEQQERLSSEQAELSRQQAQAGAKAEAAIKAIIDQALSRGIAQPTPKQ
jgi:beta-lactamase regulating signal transducer with metallopeptidase domain